MKICGNRVTSALMGGLAITTLIGCGDLTQVKNALEKRQTGSDNDNSSMNLTDAAAQTEIENATATANQAEVVPSFLLDGTLPAYLQVVKDARDYTRKLLGLTSDPIKEYHAAIKAARALSTSPEDFEANVAPARAKFEQDMAAQKQQVGAAKAQHADELAKILSATQKVFIECGDDFDQMMDPRGRHHGGKGHGKDGHRGDGDHGRGHGKGPGKGRIPGFMHLADDPTSTATGTSTSTSPSPVTTTQADSAACKDASAALKTLITPST